MKNNWKRLAAFVTVLAAAAVLTACGGKGDGGAGGAVGVFLILFADVSGYDDVGAGGDADDQVGDQRDQRAADAHGAYSHAVKVEVLQNGHVHDVEHGLDHVHDHDGNTDGQQWAYIIFF